MAKEMSPILLPAWAASMPATSAASAVAISFWSSARGTPTMTETAESDTQPSTAAAKSRLSRSPSRRS